MRRYSLLVFFLSVFTGLTAQVFPTVNYPQNYFRNPLNIPISLAGNFGELRPNHYHMGLDIRTEKRENLPVYAAADGYISRIKVEPAGFGQAIYINHPNGFTTVYAHLNEFFPALSAYIKKQQYQAESWRVFLTIPKDMFPVKKGDLIAYSGNTGGSEAPHVHFEIRNTATDINYNPMLFGLPISDKTAPVILRLALYDRTKSIYEASPKIFPVKKLRGGGNSVGAVLTSNSPKVSFGISAYDTESGTPNRNGIFESDIYEDGNPVIGFQMNNIGYDNTRNINAHIDYKTKAGGGPFIQQLFLLSGYTHSIYNPLRGDGVLDISDGKIHNIRVEVKDPYGNKTELKFGVHYRPAAAGSWEPGGKKFYTRMLDTYETNDCAFYIGERCLYDSVHVLYTKSASVMPGSVSLVHHIGSPNVPLQDSFLVRIRPSADLAPSDKNRVVMIRTGGGKRSVEKVEWQDGWASARFRDFGEFQLIVDKEPPAILPVGNIDGANLSRAQKIIFTVRDNLESFKNFRAELDGKWLRFSNDKGKSFVYIFDEHCPPGRHELKISVEDEAGNANVRTLIFNR